MAAIAISPGPTPAPGASAEAQRAEIERFASEIARLQSGEISDADFRAFRLENGVYGIRFQKDVQMVRVKVPYGLLRADQLERLARVSRDYSNGAIHVTTRQDVQVYWIPLGRIPSFLADLAEVGLTTREASGNTVRNVIACPEAGVSATESFDVTPYAHALSAYFLRNPVCQDLPRKFKIAFSGCAEDCTMTAIHDLGFLARLREENGREARGFRVLVGGGLGPLPRAAQVLVDFAPAEDYLPLAEAVIRVFDRRGNRAQRHRARLKFLLEDLGIEAFRQLVLQEARVVRQTRPGSMLLDVPAVELPVRVPAPVREVERPLPGFDTWFRTNAKEQKQPGHHVAYVALPSGDLTADQLEGIARLARKYSDGTLRTTPGQNLLLRWIPTASLPSLHADLVRLNLGGAGANGLGNVLACPGAETCALAVTKSHRLARVLSETLRATPDLAAAEDFGGVRIRVSGCPNACGQHHVAPIGLYGGSRRLDGRSIPTYRLLVGGEVAPGGIRFARVVGEVPAKRAPEAVVRLLDLYRSRREGGERFQDWVWREGAGLAALVRDALRDLIEPDGGALDTDLFRDWGDAADFVLRTGQGECAAPPP